MQIVLLPLTRFGIFLWLFSIISQDSNNTGQTSQFYVLFAMFNTQNQEELMEVYQ